MNTGTFLKKSWRKKNWKGAKNQATSQRQTRSNLTNSETFLNNNSLRFPLLTVINSKVYK